MSDRTTEYSPRLYNEDLAPAEARNWGTYSLFAMWMSDIHSVGGYTFAAGLFALGLSALGVFSALTAGIAAVFFLMNLSGYAGQKMGVPYPVLSRISFGTLGANLPALIRALVAIFWYAVQTFFASEAVVILALKIWPSLSSLTENKILGLHALGWFAYLFMWAVQLLLLRNGMETIRRFQDFAGPAVWVVMFALAFYILQQANWNVSLTIGAGEAKFGAIHAWLAAFATTVAYFAALLLNFCDFARFAPSKKAVFTANLWGLPANFIAFTVVSVLVTAGTKEIYGEYIYDPVKVVGKIDNTFALLLGALTFAIATLGINVVANFVSPAYDLANVAPGKIDFKKGGLISAVIALFLFPWMFAGSESGFQKFIIMLGAFLGPLFGVIMVDYFKLRKQQVLVSDLYRERGHYSYGTSGWNPKAVISALAGVVPAIIVTQAPALAVIADFAWFLGAGIGAGLYYVLAKNDPYVLDAIRAAEAYDLAALDIDQPERDRVDIDQGSPGNPEPRVLPGTDQ